MGGIHLNGKTKIWLVRIILTGLSILMIAWIFSNSLKDSAQSCEDSSKVTEVVQEVIETIAPETSLGGETKEEDFDILHGAVRNFAHFGEFALLGALVTWCVLSYTQIKYFLIIPFPFCVGIALFDEYLQTFSEGRAQEFADVLIDSLGAATGFAFALIAVWLGVCVWRRVCRRRAFVSSIEK